MLIPDSLLPIHNILWDRRWFPPWRAGMMLFWDNVFIYHIPTIKGHVWSLSHKHGSFCTRPSASATDQFTCDIKRVWFRYTALHGIGKTVPRSESTHHPAKVGIKTPVCSWSYFSLPWSIISLGFGSSWMTCQQPDFTLIQQKTIFLIVWIYGLYQLGIRDTSLNSAQWCIVTRY